MTTEYAPLPPGMGQCSVTGAIVPEDELVTIQGQRVCAEGKAILLDRLRAGETLPGEVEKPTVLRRFGAILLDSIILSLTCAAIGAVIGAINYKTIGQPNNPLFGVISLIAFVITTAYFTLLHGTRGQTVGKMAAGLRVVNNTDNSPISMQTALLRAFYYTGPNLVSSVVLFSMNATLINVATVVVWLYGLVNLICALVDSDRQRSLHDRLAGTRVIEKQ